VLAKTGLKWDISVDVIVVGSGCAGVVAAVTANEEKADVLILEKQPAETHHTNTSMSGGIFISPSDAKGVALYLENLCRADGEISWTEKDVIKAWADNAIDNLAWVQKNGGKTHLLENSAGHAGVPGCETIVTYRFNGLGEGLAAFLLEQLKTRSIPVLFQTSVTRLLTNAQGEVIGVEAESLAGGQVKRISVRAKKGVILACGGFEFNEQMKLNFLRVYPCYFNGSEANTGDGVRMAMEVGADLWHMNCISGGFGLKVPGIEPSFACDLRGMRHVLIRPGGGHIPPEKRAGFIIVDRSGKRFLNESKTDHSVGYVLTAFDNTNFTFPRVPSHWIFDRKRFELGPLPLLTSGPAGPSRLYHWSSDNSLEVEKGWIKTSGSIRELAGQIEVPPDILESSINEYNGFCDKGIDGNFGRIPGSLIRLDHAPYYAVRLLPGGPNTQGGPRRNARSEVVRPGNEPIPGLYSAGELGSIFGMLYNRGGNLSECIAFGRIAGQNAAHRRA
jgi:succinate dehydrogenase/fumarate reductase flavoprotein subunit